MPYYVDTSWHKATKEKGADDIVPDVTYYLNDYPTITSKERKYK